MSSTVDQPWGMPRAEDRALQEIDLLVAQAHQLRQERQERQQYAELFDQAYQLRKAAEAARDAGRAAAFQLYLQAIDSYSQLYERTLGSERLYGASLVRDLGDVCLRTIRMMAWSLVLITYRAYPWTRALDCARELVRRYPDSADEWDVLAKLSGSAGIWPDALHAAEKTVALDPGRLLSHFDVGRAHLALGELASGRECFERAIEMGRSSAAERLSTMNARLLLGHYHEGWRDWALMNNAILAGQWSRWANGQGSEAQIHRAATPLVGQVPWRGERIAGRLLLHLEHGQGDGFMMVRWVPRVRARVGRLCLQVRPELAPLLAGQWPDVQVVTWEEDPGAFERCCLSYSLPHLFGVERPEDLAAAPYLCAPEDFRPLPGAFRVGICWAGDPYNSYDWHRSTPLSAWRPVLDVPAVTFYSLQLGAAAQQLGALGGLVDDLRLECRLHDLSPELTDWRRTAAAIQHLDLVISVDTSVAHLAGALGRPTWICLNTTPDWRWMLERSDTPWYGRARLFRQERVGDWSSVFEGIAAELRQLVAASYQRDALLGGKAEMPR